MLRIELKHKGGTFTIERSEINNVTDVINDIISMFYVADLEYEEVKKSIIEIAERLQNNHSDGRPQTDKNTLPL